MPLPRPDQMDAYTRKGVELVLRSVGVAPEQRAARRLRAQAPVGGTGPRVLFLCPRDWVEHVQCQGVLAQALRLRSARVSFLTCGGGLEICDRANTYEAPPMPCRTCRRYTATSLDAHGFERSTVRQGWEIDDPGDWPELDAVPAESLGAVEADGLPLGALTQIPVAWFLCAGDHWGDPLAPSVRRAFLRSARRVAAGLSAAFDRHRPDVVVVTSGLFLFEALAWELCRRRGIDVVSYERAFRPDTLVFDREHPAGHYDFSRAWPSANRPLSPVEAAELDEYLARRRRAAAADQFWTFRPAEPATTGRTTVLFTNVTWDSAVVGRDLGFAGIGEWLDTAVDEFARRPTEHLVVRIHPSELHLPGKRSRDPLGGRLARRSRGVPPNVSVVGPEDLTDSYALMEQAHLGLVYTSTVGLELALAGRPVVVAGRTHYRGKGFTIDVDDPDGFRAAVGRVLADPAAHRADVELARRYAHFFFFRAPYDAPGVSEPLPGLARITVDELADLAPGADPELDRLCDAILQGGSFVSG